jgi:hypothetical protein
MKGNKIIKTVVNDKMLNAEQLKAECHRAISLEEVQETTTAKRRISMQFAGVAAAAAVFVFGTVFMFRALAPESDVSDPLSTTQSVAQTRQTAASALKNAPDGFIPTGGFIAERDGWIYFSELYCNAENVDMSGPSHIDSTKTNLAKARLDGSDKTILDGDLIFVDNIVVPGDGWVYYMRIADRVGEAGSERNNGLFRIREDGTMLSNLSPAGVNRNFVIVGERIYFIAGEPYTLPDERGGTVAYRSDFGNLCSVKTDGTDFVTLIDYDVPSQEEAYNTAFEEWKSQFDCECVNQIVGTIPDMPYECSENCSGYFSQSFDTLNFPSIDGAYTMYYYKDGWLYYGDGAFEGLRKVRPDGSDKQKAEGRLFNPAEFFTPLGLWSVTVQTSAVPKSNTRALGVVRYEIIGEQVYYTLNNNGEVWRIGIDGENNEQIAELPADIFTFTEFFDVSEFHSVTDIRIIGNKVYLHTSLVQPYWERGNYNIWVFEIEEGEIAVPVKIT